MPKYRVIHPSFLKGCYQEAGTEIEYDGPPGSNLEPLDAEAKKAAAAWRKQTGERMSCHDPDFTLEMARTIPRG